jgi:hypothetical protein
MRSRTRFSLILVATCIAIPGCGGDGSLTPSLDAAPPPRSDASPITASEELILDPSYRPSAAWGEHHKPSVAWNGSAYVVVWQYSAGRIKLARVSPQGQVLDSPYLEVPDPDHVQTDPRIACSTAGTCLISWIRWNDFSFGDHAVVATTVDVNGVVSPAPALVLQNGNGGVNFGVSSTSTGFLVAWSHADEILAQAVALDGTAAGPAQAVLSPTQPGETFFEVELACNPDQCLVSSRSSGLQPPANPRWARPIGIDAVPALPAIDLSLPDSDGLLAGDGQGFALAYHHGPGHRLLRIAADGNPVGMPVDLFATTTGGGRPTLAFDGTSYVVSLVEYGGSSQKIVAERVSPIAGGPSPDQVVMPIVLASETRLAAACGPDQCLVTGTHFFDLYEVDILGARVDSTGSLDPQGFFVSQGDATQSLGGVATDGDSFVVVWEERGVIPSEIRSAHVSGDGQLIGAVNVIATSAELIHPPSIAFDGSNYHVVWIDLATLMLRQVRLDASGQLAGTETTAQVSTLEFRPHQGIDCVADTCLVAWAGLDGIYARRLDGAGQWIDAEAVGLGPGDYSSTPSVAHHGGNFLIACEQPGNGEYSFSAFLIPVDGPVATPQPIELDITDLGSGSYQSARVVATSTGFLAMWPRYGNGQRTVFTRHLAPTGQPGPVAAAPEGLNPEWTLAMIPAGDDTLFAWYEVTSFPALFIDDSEAVLEVARYASDDRPLDVTPHQFSPFVLRGGMSIGGATNATGQTLLVRDAFDTSAAERAPRLRARLLTW